MEYKVSLTYFRPTGKFLWHAETTIARDEIVDIWNEVDDMRRLGSLPGLRPGSGRDLFVLIDVPDHPQRIPHIAKAQFLDEDDVTTPRTPTGEMLPLVRLPQVEIPRTTTRDVVRPDPSDHSAASDIDTVVGSEEVTPVDVPIPKPALGDISDE